MRLPLTGKPYTSKSVIASSQESVNLYAEINDDPQAPAPITHYPMPGSVLFGTPAVAGASRCTYRTSIGTAYMVVGPSLYFVAESGAMILIGLLTDRPSQIIMSDNGLVLVLVDGTQGWAVDLASNNFGPIVDPAFYGADFTVFLDTFFVFNRPDTNQFYISLSMVTFAMLTGGTAFDPLDIAAKSGSADNIVGISTTHKELWLIGELTTEVWIGTGAADFYFQLQQGAYIDHGCGAQFSITSQDVLSFFIAQDKQGKNLIVQAGEYQIKEVSTPYLVNLLNSSDVSDAIGTCFQIEDHAFYCLSLPTLNRTFLYDLTTGLWSRWSWLNIDDGTNNRHRTNTAMFVYGFNLIGDWETGKIWKLDPNVYLDNGNPIVHWRTFMHIVGDEYERITYQSFDADFECGTTDQIDLTQAGAELPSADLSWSDNKGKTFSDPVRQSFGNLGEFLTTMSWNRLGMARDRVYKLQWSSPIKTALNGAFITFKPCRS